MNLSALSPHIKAEHGALAGFKRPVFVYEPKCFSLTICGKPEVWKNPYSDVASCYRSNFFVAGAWRTILEIHAAGAASDHYVGVVLDGIGQA